jgi:orotidine 5'-phosphate decarboxylase subfamily 2
MSENRNTTKAHIRLCAGVDPAPDLQSQTGSSTFAERVRRHAEVLRQSPQSPKILKPNLAFFLAGGSTGLKLLEDFVGEFAASKEIIIDAKCNEIANSMESWLTFVFRTLGATGVTINPFLGEKSIELALSYAAKYAGARGRVYTLCATSETSSAGLAFLQGQPQTILAACASARDKVTAGDPTLANVSGVVVGANRADVLFRPELAASRLAVLAPGLGAQGAAWSVIGECGTLPNEITFPLSRAIFDAGNRPVDQALLQLKEVSQRFV